MAFTVDQNVSGASAAAGPVVQNIPQPPAVNILGGLLDVADSYGRAQRSQGGPTQNDRDNKVYAEETLNVKADIAAGMSPDQVAMKYGTVFANLNLNEEQRNNLTKIVGEDIFYVPKQVDSPADIQAELFNSADALTQLGFIDIEMKKAQEDGEPISRDVAANRAAANYAAFQTAANAGILQGNIDFVAGFDQNMRTIDGFTDAVSKALQVEQRGENFSLESLQQLRDGFLLLKSQPAFQKPTSARGLEKWEMMETRLNSIDKLFEQVADYDAKGATAEAKQLMGVVALSGNNPLSALAASSPEFMTKMAAQIAPDITAELASMGDIPVIDHSTLDFDPSVLELMGVAPSGNQTGEVPEGGFDVPPSPFPDEVGEKYSEMNLVTQAKSRSYHRAALTGLQAAELTTPEAVNAYASSVTALSYDLTQNERPSFDNFNVLFSNSNIARLNKLQAAGGESGRVAAQLRAQMGAALVHNQTRYGILAAGKVDTIPNIGIDPTTNKFTITDTSTRLMQEIAAVADVYYGGDFEALWKEGYSARLKLRDRLTAEGKIAADTPEYDRFLAATNVLDTSLWKGLSGQYGKVKGIPQRLQQFKDVAKRMQIALPEEQVAQDAVDTVEGSITQTPLEDLGTQTNPYTLGGENADEAETDAAFDALPAGAFFINPADGRLLQKKG